MDSRAKKILDFWFIETPAEKRFKKDEKFDQIIKEKFLSDYELATKNKLDRWQDTSKGCLALIILLDQFSRNLFRDNKKVFEQDVKARLIVNKTINNNFLDQMNVDERFFMLLPLIHSEEISDHENAYKLMDQHLINHPDLDKIKKFWIDHTNTIKRFNRYPHRNKVLGRKSTDEEIGFLKNPNSSW